MADSRTVQQVIEDALSEAQDAGLLARDWFDFVQGEVTSWACANVVVNCTIHLEAAGDVYETCCGGTRSRLGCAYHDPRTLKGSVRIG